jgi:hypothetical protein
MRLPRKLAGVRTGGAVPDGARSRDAVLLQLRNAGLDPAPPEFIDRIIPVAGRGKTRRPHLRTQDRPRAGANRCIDTKHNQRH